MENVKSKVDKFHKNRRIFAIIDNILYIAPVDTTFSHLEWLEHERLLKTINKNLDNIIRGFVDCDGLYFYEGDFAINKRAEYGIFKHLNDLINKLRIDKNFHIYGGFIKGEVGQKWLPIKDYGVLKDLLR